MGRKALFEGVERTGPDVSVDDANRGQSNRRKFLLIVSFAKLVRYGVVYMGFLAFI